MATKECINIIGNGVVFNLDALFSEIEKNGFKFGTGEDEGDRKLFISDCAHLVLPVHIEADGFQESLLEEKALGFFVFCIIFGSRLVYWSLENKSEQESLFVSFVSWKASVLIVRPILV